MAEAASLIMDTIDASFVIIQKNNLPTFAFDTITVVFALRSL